MKKSVILIFCVIIMSALAAGCTKSEEKITTDGTKITFTEGKRTQTVIAVYSLMDSSEVANLPDGIGMKYGADKLFWKLSIEFEGKAEEGVLRDITRPAPEDEPVVTFENDGFKGKAAEIPTLIMNDQNYTHIYYYADKGVLLETYSFTYRGHKLTYNLINQEWTYE